MKYTKLIIISVLLLGTFISTFVINAQTKRINPDRWVPKYLLPSTLQNKSKALVIKKDFSITLRDGAVMDASKFYPNEPNPYLASGYPTVIMAHGYGDRKETLEGFASAQASFGYVVYTFSFRGQGNSGGLSNLISMTEANDLIELVNYVRGDFETGLDTSKILIMGGSQGGMVPFMAATTGLLNVKTIISSVASPEFASSWIENGSVKMSFLWTISYTPDSARYNNQVTAMQKWVYATGQKSKFWDSLYINLPVNRDFINSVQNVKIPMLLENSWQDYFFNTHGNIKALPLLTNEHKIYFGAVMGHGGDTSYKETIWHMNFFNQWFYKFLWNDSTGYINIPKYNLAYTTYPRHHNMWSFEHDSTNVFPPVNTSSIRLYFVQNGKLSQMKTTSTSYASFLNDVRSTRLTLEEAVNNEFKGPYFDSLFKITRIAFETTPLSSSMKMIGTPLLNLKYLSNANICQYNFQIYEVNASGEKNLVSRINYTDRDYTANSQRTKAINGTSHGHIFQAGSKIRIEVTNFDFTPSDSLFLGTNPYVLPVMRRATNRIYYNASFIDLPVVNAGIISVTNAEKEDAISNGFELNQNYPNPFNPVTNIKFNLPPDFSGEVSLKIFDITGREIADLYNGALNSGEHNIKWDGTGFSSGVYFYRLQAGEFSEVRKMMLLK